MRASQHSLAGAEVRQTTPSYSNCRGEARGEAADALVRIEQYLRERLVPQHGAQDHARVERDVGILVPVSLSLSRQLDAAHTASRESQMDAPCQCGKDRVFLGAQMLDCRPACADLSPQEVVENLRDVLSCLWEGRRSSSELGVAVAGPAEQERTSNSKRQMCRTRRCRRSFA